MRYLSNLMMINKMKAVALLLSTAFCQVALWSDPLVFATPVESDKAELLLPLIETGEGILSFEQMGIYRWVQKIQNRDFLLYLLKGDDVEKSLELLKSNSLVKNIELRELTPLMNVEIENEEGEAKKEYCFIYPILPSKIKKLEKMYQEPSEYFSEQIQNIYRYRGISKMQMWIQEESFLVIYQEITGSVKEARKKYLTSKEEDLSKTRALEFSDITGLCYEELLPQLTSLFDLEILD